MKTTTTRILTLVMAMAILFLAACSDSTAPSISAPAASSSAESLPVSEAAQHTASEIEEHRNNPDPHIPDPAAEEVRSMPAAEPQPDKTHTITFPTSDMGKTEFNAAVYEIAPFELSFVLPAGWTVKEREQPELVDKEIALSAVWSVHDIYAPNGDRVGAVGYNTYEEYEGAEDNPQAIYNQIALGNNYRFDVRDSYKQVKQAEYGVTAMCDVYYSANMNNGSEKTNYGVVSNHKDLLVYVAMEFISDGFSERRVRQIAESIKLRGQGEPTLESLLAEHGIDKYVVDNAFAEQLENIDLLEEWIENYWQKKPGKAAVLLDGMGFPSGLYIFESDGDASYTITEYTVPNDGAISPPEVYESSVVIKRAYDYVFGADWSADILSAAFIVHHTPRPVERTELYWNPDTDAPLGSITPKDAEERAEAVSRRIHAHVHFLGGVYVGGVYVRESMVEAAPPPDYAGHTFFYKTVEAVEYGGRDYYMVYAHTDQAALNRGEHGGYVTAVSSDGRLAFTISMVDGGWIFVDDAELEIITPN